MVQFYTDCLYEREDGIIGISTDTVKRWVVNNFDIVTLTDGNVNLVDEHPVGSVIDCSEELQWRW